MNEFLMGAMAMGCVVASLFFLRFWRDTHERFFILFALSFLLLGGTRIGLAYFHYPSEGHAYLHWIRFIAFALILVAIIDNNRRLDHPSA